jgi:hypothetical protein
MVDLSIVFCMFTTVVTCRTYHTSDGFASYFITTYDILRQLLLWQHCYENYQPIITSVFLILITTADVPCLHLRLGPLNQVIRCT